ncbi:MAG: type II CRISPR RNA-guided endonuclease Cas9 [Flavobacteriales bacterium]
MKKILGLDLGVASIGWAYTAENEGESKILGMGVRVIPLSSEERDEFTKGNAISKNAKRRLKRGMRRNAYRRTMRKDLLKKALSELNMLPPSELFEAVSKMGIWELRSRAALEKISPQELGRVLYHINQKRGFKSSRKTEGQDGEATKESEYKAQIRLNAEKLIASNMTLGQWVFSQLQEDEHFKLKGMIFPREVYLNEFDTIWSTQSKYFDVLNEEQYQKIKLGIIFHQRPLKSQKALVSRCEFVTRFKEVNGKRMNVSPRVSPRTAPIAQWSKILEAVNNLDFKDKYRKSIEIEKERLFELAGQLKFKEKMTTKEIYKFLKLSNDVKSNITEKGIQGDTTWSAIAKVLKNYPENEHLLSQLESWEITYSDNSKTDVTTGEITVFPEVDDSYQNHVYQRLWHLLYSVDDEKSLIKNLKEDFGISEECAEYLSKLDFTKAGFSNKSAKAMRLIIPHLMMGHQYSKAMEFAGFRHSDYLTKLENVSRDLLSKLPNLPKNSLRQPVVERVLNQLINLINAIMEEPSLGRPDEIRVELARELQQSKEERNKSSKNISAAEKRNKQIEDKLRNEFGFKKVNKSLINKYKMHEELGGVSIYTGKGISLADFLNGNGVEVEHIIPRSRLFDDSFSNKTMSESWVNKAKGNMTAYDFMLKQPVPGLLAFEDYVDMVNSLVKGKDAGISKTKQKRLLTPQSEIPNDFINRQLRETQYISKKAAQILALVCRDVKFTSGGMTDFLRDKWGWNDVLKKINWTNYEKQGLTQIEPTADGRRLYHIKDWSKRDDHRHHAIDALVVACTKQSYIQTLNNLNQLVEKGNADNLKELDHVKIKEFSGLSPFSTDQVIQEVEKINVSYKRGKRVGVKSKNKSTQHVHLIPRGALSEETVYGKIKLRVKRKAKLNKEFDPSWVIVDKQLRKLVQDRLRENDFDSSKAFKKKLFYDASETVQIKDVEIWDWQEEVVVKYPLTALKRKDCEYIVDELVKEKVIAFFDSFADEKEALKNIGTSTIWFNEKKGIPIRTVRLKTGLGKVVPLNESDGEDSHSFVKPGNNHHLAVYQREDGTYFDKMVSFQEAFAAMQSGLPVYQKELEGAKLVWKFEQNDMFIIKNEEGVERLYRVQKITKKSNGAIDVWFRLNSEAILKDSSIHNQLGLFYNFRSLTKIVEVSPRAVKINYLGRLTND